MNGTQAYILSKKYADDTIKGAGAVAGKNCTIKSIVNDTTNKVSVVTFEWTKNDGTTTTSVMSVPFGVDGKEISSATIDASNHLILTMSDSSTIDAGVMPQAKVEISKDSGNAIENKADGLYVSKTGVVISPNTGNILTNKSNGLYVPETDLTDYAKTADVVAKESGKGLSSNDFTTSLKTKLEGLPSDAQKNIQSDWNQTDNTKDDFIKNKPSIPSEVKISADAGNQLKVGTDTGWYVPVCPVDNALSATSENAVQNKVVNTALDTKVDKVTGKGLSTNDYDATEKAEVAKVKDKIDKNQGAANAGKSLIVGADGTVTLGNAQIDIATSFGATPSDTKVPSEKLVKTELDKKVNIAQTVADKGKALVVGDDGNITLGTVATDGLEIVDKTTAEYNALTDEQKNDATKLYNITDADDLDLTSYAKQSDVDAINNNLTDLTKDLTVNVNSNVFSNGFIYANQCGNVVTVQLRLLLKQDLNNSTVTVVGTIGKKPKVYSWLPCLVSDDYYSTNASLGKLSVDESSGEIKVMTLDSATGKRGVQCTFSYLVK